MEPAIRGKLRFGDTLVPWKDDLSPKGDGLVWCFDVVPTEVDFSIEVPAR